MAEALASRCALDETGMSATTWSVPSSRRTTPGSLERGERVVGDLRQRPRCARSASTFADVPGSRRAPRRPPARTEAQPALLALPRPARRSEGPPLVGQERGVAPTAAATLGRQPPIAVADEVDQHRAVTVLTTVPTGTWVTVSPAPPSSFLPCRGPLRPVGGVVTVGDQGADVAIRHQPRRHPCRRCPIGATAARRSLPSERHAPGATVAAAHIDPTLVDERGHGLPG